MNRTISTLLVSAVVTLSFSSAFADYYQEENSEVFRTRKLSGPRMGMSYAIPDGGKLQERLKEAEMSPFISQFGWHFEWIVEPEERGPAFIIEALPLFGGVEYGIVLPSVSLVMGIRLPTGFEFGMGPMVYAIKDSNKPIGTALVMAVGKSLDFNSVSIPLNLAISTNPEGTRVSFVFGYAMAKNR